MRVLYFGTYERDYPRNAQVISCLRKAGVDVGERHAPVWEGREHKWAAGCAHGAAARAPPSSASAQASAIRFDALIVGYPGHLDLPAARRAARGRPVVFNPLVSLADTLVEDRGRFRAGLARRHARSRRRPHAFRAGRSRGRGHRGARRVLPRARRSAAVEVCFVGAEERLFTPGWRHRTSSSRSSSAS